MHRKNGPDKTFYFKQFQINHDRCAMKVGTDGVLIGAWCDVSNARRVLDVGTGTGLVALMVAQRTTHDALIDAVEIDHEAYKQALENVDASKWRDRIQVHHLAIQNFQPQFLYELIVCNPPYFNNSLKSPDEKRSLSRHASHLTPVDLVMVAKKLLNPLGTLSLILPYREGMEFINLAAKHSLFCNRQTEIRTKRGKEIERLLLEFNLYSKIRDTEELILETGKSARSELHQRLVSEFYL